MHLKPSESRQAGLEGEADSCQGGLMRARSEWPAARPSWPSQEPPFCSAKTRRLEERERIAVAATCSIVERVGETNASKLTETTTDGSREAVEEEEEEEEMKK